MAAMTPRRSARRSSQDLLGSAGDHNDLIDRFPLSTAGGPQNPPQNEHVAQTIQEAVARPAAASQVGPEVQETTNQQKGKAKKKPAEAEAEAEPGKEQAASEPIKARKRAPFERVWSRADEVMILEALAEHVDRHGALPRSSELFAAIADGLENKSSGSSEFAGKVKKLRRRYEKDRQNGCPNDKDGRQFFELCDKVWGRAACSAAGDASSGLRKTNVVQPQQDVQLVGGVDMSNRARAVGEADEDAGEHKAKKARAELEMTEQGDVEAPRARREFDELCKVYPFLAEELQEHMSTCKRAASIKAGFERLDDSVVSSLEALCKKQRKYELKVIMRHASLTKKVLHTVIGSID